MQTTEVYGTTVVNNSLKSSTNKNKKKELN